MAFMKPLFSITKLTRVLETLKYSRLLAITAVMVWYIRSQPIPVASHTVNAGPVVRSVMGIVPVTIANHE